MKSTVAGWGRGGQTSIPLCDGPFTRLVWGRHGFDGDDCGGDGKPRSVRVTLVKQAWATTITGESQLALAA